MGGPHFLGLLIWIVLIVPPFWKILPRYGVSPYFALVAIVPAVALVLLWIVAFKDESGESGA